MVALRRRRPPSGLIVHSDRGSEFLGTAFQAHRSAHGALQSMTRGGAPDENAHMASFCHLLKAELLHGLVVTTAEALRAQLAPPQQGTPAFRARLSITR